MTVKIEVVLSDKAMEVIHRSASEHKRDEWLSNAVVEYDRIVSVLLVAQPAEDSVLEHLESRLATVGRLLAMLIQKIDQRKDARSRHE